MKTITIGRDSGCDIYIDDRLISRRHALLRIHPTGKMELVDMSSNGTYVNNVRLVRNVPFPISRKDKVNFAGVKQLDWRLVPNPLSWVKWAVLAIVILLLLLVLGTLINKCSSSAPSYSEDTEIPVSKPNEKTESGTVSPNKSTTSDTKESNETKGEIVSAENSETKESSQKNIVETKTVTKTGSKADSWPDRSRQVTTNKPQKGTTDIGKKQTKENKNTKTENNSEEIITGV